MNYVQPEISPEALASLKDVHNFVSNIVGEVYLVGGAVRDALLFDEFHTYDFDFSTPLRPDAVEAAIEKAGYKPQTKGKMFGTVSFEVEDFRYEITTFRTEFYFPKNRKPQVDFIDDIEADLSRRDFTINAIAFDGENFIDPYCGCDDIKTHVLRCIGEPKERFMQDPLRMLRAGRFVSELDFVADEKIEAALMSCRKHVLDISKERISDELDRIICSVHPAQGLCLLGDTGLIPYILPEAIFASLVVDGYANLGKRLESLPGVPDTRWSALFFFAGMAFSPDGDEGAALIAKQLAERVAFSLHWKKDRLQNAE
jgi:poly(A) polymerase